MKKILLYFFLGLLLLLIIGGIVGARYIQNQWFRDRPNYVSLTASGAPIPFAWDTTQYPDHVELHDAMRVPVRIPGLPFKFYMQWDTGSPLSFWNKSTVSALQRYGRSWEVEAKEETQWLKDVQLEVGSMPVEMTRLRLLHQGAEWDLGDTLAEYRLGTLGTDLMEGHVTLVDFARQELRFFAKKPAWMDTLPAFQSFDFQGRRLMLPATIQGKEMELFYDSGASAFGLLTSKNRYDAYTDPDEPEIHYEANAFGNDIPVYHKLSPIVATMGGTKVPLQRISYVKWYDKMQGFLSSFTDIGGWMGNLPFLETVLIVDAQTQSFLVLPNHGL
ncbi:MAG: hypothetical protein AAFR61_13800 [Bacteroidota bacterium]